MLENARSQYNWQQKSTFTSNVEIFEKDINIMETYCRQLERIVSSNNLAKEGAFDDAGLVPAGNPVSSITALDLYLRSLLPISDIFCYMPESASLPAPGYFTMLEEYFSHQEYISDDEYKDLMKALTSFSGPDKFILFNSVYVYIAKLNEISDNILLCFVIDKTTLYSLFECLNNNMDYSFVSIYAGDNVPENNILLLSSNSSVNSTFVSDITDTGSPKVSIDMYYSDNTGFTYYFSYPSYEQASNFKNLQIMYYIFIVVAFIGCLALIFLLSKRNMKPLFELDEQLQVTKREKVHLQEVMDNQRPLLFQSYVWQLLNGTVTSEHEAAYIKDFLGIPEGNMIYNCLYVVAYNDIADPACAPDAPEEYSAIIFETFKRHLEQHLCYYNPSDHSYTLIIMMGETGDDNDLIMRTNENIVKAHDELLDTYGIWIFAGIGKNTDDILNVWESYQQAVEAVNYTGKNYIFFPYEFIKKNSSAFYYPAELSTKLIHFITTGNTSQVMELFNLLHQENIEERSLPINMLQFLLSDIRNTLLKARFALPQNTPEEDVKSLDEYFNRHVSFKLCEDIALKLCKLFVEKKDDSDIISEIEKYINDNYADPSIGLTKISDKFQISESYFSHLFKEKKGVNFSTYLENIRMNKASKLIRETDISLNELYLSVGYNNASSFRRAFKKVYGATPSAMRDSKSSININN